MFTEFTDWFCVASCKGRMDRYINRHIDGHLKFLNHCFISTISQGTALCATSLAISPIPNLPLLSVFCQTRVQTQMVPSRGLITGQWSCLISWFAAIFNELALQDTQRPYIILTFNIMGCFYKLSSCHWKHLTHSVNNVDRTVSSSIVLSARTAPPWMLKPQDLAGIINQIINRRCLKKT